MGQFYAAAVAAMLNKVSFRAPLDIDRTLKHTSATLENAAPIAVRPLASIFTLKLIDMLNVPDTGT